MIGPGGYEVRMRVMTTSGEPLAEIEHDLNCVRGLCKCMIRGLAFIRKFTEDNALNSERPEIELRDAQTNEILAQTHRNAKKAPPAAGRHWIKTTLSRDTIAQLRRMAHAESVPMNRIVDKALRAQKRPTDPIPRDGTETRFAIEAELRFNVERRALEADLSIDKMIATFICGWIESASAPPVIDLAPIEPDPTEETHDEAAVEPTSGVHAIAPATSSTMPVAEAAA